MASFLTAPWEDVLGVLHEVEIVANGDSPELVLLTRNTATGGLDEFSSISTGWTRARVNQGFGVFSDEFQIAENLIDGQDARKIAAVRHGGVIYFLMEAKIPPAGFDRYWRFPLKPLEVAQ